MRILVVDDDDTNRLVVRLLMERRATQATLLLKSHIETSKAEVRKITLHTLHLARKPPLETP